VWRIGVPSFHGNEQESHNNRVYLSVYKQFAHGNLESWEQCAIGPVGALQMSRQFIMKRDVHFMSLFGSCFLLIANVSTVHHEERCSFYVTVWFVFSVDCKCLYSSSWREMFILCHCLIAPLCVAFIVFMWYKTRIDEMMNIQMWTDTVSVNVGHSQCECRTQSMWMSDTVNVNAFRYDCLLYKPRSVLAKLIHLHIITYFAAFVRVVALP
jgi:hypothetical protein